MTIHISINSIDLGFALAVQLILVAVAVLVWKGWIK